MGEIVDRRLQSSNAPPDVFAHYSDYERAAGKDDLAARRRMGEHAKTLFVAGALTTVEALMWALYILARDTTAQDFVAAEACSVGLAAESGLDDFERLPHTLAVFKETLRLYPPVTAFARMTVRDDVVAGISISAGTRVLISPYVLGRHRDYWSNADDFDPTRFFPHSPEPNKIVYIPFGTGPRVCLGQFLATVESVLFLACLLKEHRLEVAQDDNSEPTLRFGLRVGRKVRFRLTPRSYRDVRWTEIRLWRNVATD
jgi:cytochrome P450